MYVNFVLYLSYYCVYLFSLLDLALMSVVPLTGVKVESAVLGERAFGMAAEGPGRGLLLFPEICTMELQLLATGPPDLEVLSHVFHSLLGAVSLNPRNAALLYDQVRLCSTLPLRPHCQLPYPSTNVTLPIHQRYSTHPPNTNATTPLPFIGRSQNHLGWLSQHPQPIRLLL